jgi:hypothetical protein
MVELSELRKDRDAARTIAAGSEEPARVVARVRELGVEGRRNVSVPRRLKTLASCCIVRTVLSTPGRQARTVADHGLRPEGFR